jgi:hypothetical protein
MVKFLAETILWKADNYGVESLTEEEQVVFSGLVCAPCIERDGPRG